MFNPFIHLRSCEQCGYVFPVHYISGKCEECTLLEKKNPKCPDCDTEIEIPEDALKGEIFSCPNCGIELEVRESLLRDFQHLKKLR